MFEYRTVRRTKLYLAADWDNDSEVVEKLQQWNESNFYRLHFPDAHKVKQSRDTSLYCTIKKSLKERLDCSKTFVLIVGEKTTSVTKGNCKYCRYYKTYGSCSHNYSVDFRSYIQYECEYAAEHELKVVVIYNSDKVDREKCPVDVRYEGKHLAAYHYDSYNRKVWNYIAIKDAIMD